MARDVRSDARSDARSKEKEKVKVALYTTKAIFDFEKETKGAVRYQEVGEDGKPAFAPVIGTFYMRKSAMPGRVLGKLIIEITEYS